MEELFDLFLILLCFGILAVAVFFSGKELYKWNYPDGKNGMIKYRFKDSGNPFKPGLEISANVESPRWQSMFFKNIEMMKVISCETATKIANHQSLTQEEIDKIRKQSEHLDRKYGTDEEILSGHGYFEDPYFRKNKK